MYTGSEAINIRTDLLQTSHSPFSLVESDRRNSLLSTHGGQGGGITTHLLALLVDTGDVGAAGDVPHGDVLFHAAGQAATLLG
jgi:hypothetical protein